MIPVVPLSYGREFQTFYDRIFRKDSYAARAARELANWHPDRRLGTLELGVGTGRIALPLSDHVGTVIGIDSSPELLEQLDGEIHDQAAPVAPVRADIRSYADGERYGLVYCVCATLSLVLDAEQQRGVIERAAEHLVPGGRLVVETHNKSGVLAMHEGKSRASFFTPYPEPGTGLLTCSTLSPDHEFWYASQIWFEAGASYVGNEVTRLTTPEEVDDYAAGAGLRPLGRAADWFGTPHCTDATMFVSVYER